MANIQTALNWMTSRQGRVTYSMARRMGPSSYDCSSAVFFALRAGGFPHTSFIGNTETLFQLRGRLLQPITRSQIRAGDVFVSGVPGGSANAYGHTGFALNATQAIHCSSRFNGIGVSSNADSAVRAYGGAPVYWFRVIGSTAPTPTPDPTDPEEPEAEIITIESVNDGKKYIDNKFLIEHFGIKMGSETFDDVDGAYDTMQKGHEFMNSQPMDYQEIRLTKANLEMIDMRYSDVQVGDIVDVQNPFMNLEPRLRVAEKSIDIVNEATSELVAGKKFETLTEILGRTGR